MFTIDKEIVKVVTRLVEAANIIENNARGNISEEEQETVYTMTTNVFDCKFDTMQIYHDLREEFENVKFVCQIKRHDKIFISDCAIDLMESCFQTALEQNYQIVSLYDLNMWFGQEATSDDHFEYLILEDCPITFE